MPGHSIGGILNEGVGGGELGDAISKADIQSAYQNVRDSGQHDNTRVVKRGIDLIVA